jgi:ribosomal protein S18 acetylase RimI-like enzyme
MYTIKKDNKGKVYSAFKGKNLIGELSVQYWEPKEKRTWKDFYNNVDIDSSGQEVYIKNIYIDTEYRRQGIGTSLLNAMIDDALKNNKESIILYVNTRLLKVRSLYKSLGFKTIGKFIKPGRKNVNFIMRKTLDKMHTT